MPASVAPASGRPARHPQSPIISMLASPKDVIAPFAEYPLLWLLALVNLAAVIVAVFGSFVLSIGRRQMAWFPVGAAMAISYGLSWISRIRGGRIPVFPYMNFHPGTAGSHGYPSVTMSYNFDFIAFGLALGVIIALRKKA
jgi:hypothetical protein